MTHVTRYGGWLLVLLSLWGILPGLLAQNDLPDSQAGRTIRIFWGNDGAEDIVLRELLREFEQRTGIGVEIVLISHQDRPLEFIRAIEGDNPPDLIRHVYYNAMSDYYLDLRPYLDNVDEWDANFQAGMFQALRGANTDANNDALYGILTEFTVSAPYINRTLWEQSGVPIPGNGTEPATWQAWERASMQVQAVLSTTEHPVYAMLIDRTGHRFWGPSLSMCASYLTDDNAIQVDSPGFRQAAQMLRRWYVNGWMPETVWDAGTDNIPAERYFVDGQAAFYIGGSWQVSSFYRDIGERFDWVAVPNPVGNPNGENGDCDGRSGMPGGQVLTAVQYPGQSTEQKEAVGRLMSYLTRPENLKRFYEEALFLPAYASLQDETLNYPAGEAQLNTFRNEIAEIDESAYLLQYYPTSDEIRFYIRSALVDYVQGRSTLDQAIDSAQAQIDRLLADKADADDNLIEDADSDDPTVTTPNEP